MPDRLALEILARSLEQNLASAEGAMESLAAQIEPASNLRRLRRALHTLKGDAQVAAQRSVARWLDDLERTLEAAQEHRDFRPDLDLVGDAVRALREWTPKLTAGETVEVQGILRTRARKLGEDARQRMRGDRVRPV